MKTDYYRRYVLLLTLALTKEEDLYALYWLAQRRLVKDPNAKMHSIRDLSPLSLYKLDIIQQRLITSSDREVSTAYYFITNFIQEKGGTRQ